MTWVSIKDLPSKEGQECWICTKNNEVYQGAFKAKIADHKDPFAGEKINYKPGFFINHERGRFILIDEVDYWMPYFTPEPPKRKKK